MNKRAKERLQKSKKGSSQKYYIDWLVELNGKKKKRAIDLRQTMVWGVGGKK